MAAHRRIFVFTITLARCAPVVVTSVTAMLIHLMPVRDESVEMKMDEPGRNNISILASYNLTREMFMSTVVKVQTCRACINAIVMKTHIQQFTARNAILFCSHILSRRRPVLEFVLVIHVQSVLAEHSSVLYNDYVFFVAVFTLMTEIFWWDWNGWFREYKRCCNPLNEATDRAWLQKGAGK